jgi:CHASE3 domain sensor protein
MAYKMTLNKKILAGFILCSVVMLVVGVISFRTAKNGWTPING